MARAGPLAVAGGEPAGWAAAAGGPPPGGPEGVVVGATVVVDPPSGSVVVVVDPGAPAPALGVTGEELAEAGPKPMPLAACTLKEYAVPLDRFLITALVAGAATVADWPPGLATTRYWVTDRPPSLSGGIQVTVAAASAGAAPTPLGAPGTVGAGQAPPMALHRLTRPKPNCGSRPGAPRSSAAPSSRLRRAAPVLPVFQ